MTTMTVQQIANDIHADAGLQLTNGFAIYAGDRPLVTDNNREWLDQVLAGWRKENEHRH